MAAMDFFKDFTKLWANKGQIEPINEDQYDQGWAYIGATPPSVEEFNVVQQLSDQKVAWLYQQLAALITAGNGLPTAAGLTALRDAVKWLDWQTGSHYKKQNVLAGGAITADMAGSFIVLNTAGSTVTLPDAATLPEGSVFFILSNVDNATVKSSIAGQMVTDQKMMAGDTIEIFGNGIGYPVIGGSLDLPYSSGMFGRSLAGAGYQRMPGGLIWQWGAGATIATGPAMLSYPIAFPNAPLAVFAGAVDLTTGPLCIAADKAAGKTQLQVSAWDPARNRQVTTVLFHAIGW